MAAVLTIGNFDGVHIGHAALIARAREIAARHASRPRVIAMTFDPHPLTRLRPELAPPVLTTFTERERLLIAAGADEVVRLEPSPELLSLAPEAFVAHVVAEHAPVAIVEGPDFHFAKGRAGNNQVLAQLGRLHGFEVDVVPPVEAALGDQSIVTASSTIIRWLVQHGRVADAALILGRPYTLTGAVVRGDQRGRQIGFPTANLATPCMLPADAVYAGTAELADSRRFQAAIHVGTRSTFDDTTRTVEAYILDWAGPVAERTPEYGWPLRLEINHWLRDQARFESVPLLVEQITRDVKRTRTLVNA
jgi:riboflavin kinase/FMN adenylyltransferase